MLVTVKLLGELGRRFGREYKLEIKSAAEAIRALGSQLSGFKDFIRQSSENGITWRVVTQDPMGLDEEGLHYPCSKRVVIAPMPAGRGAIGRILLGVAMIAVLIATGGAAGFLGQAAVSVGFLGGGLILSGVAQLLTPTPESARNNNDQQLNSFTFDRSNTNTAQGSVVPVLYGERLIGALPVVSFGIELKNSL